MIIVIVRVNAQSVAELALISIPFLDLLTLLVEHEPPVLSVTVVRSVESAEVRDICESEVLTVESRKRGFGYSVLR